MVIEYTQLNAPEPLVVLRHIWRVVARVCRRLGGPQNLWIVDKVPATSIQGEWQASFACSFVFKNSKLRAIGGLVSEQVSP